MTIHGRHKTLSLLSALAITLLWLLPAARATAAPLNLATTPLFLTSGVKPNILVIYDNSESMDATMAGKLIAGSDPTTRGNIGRGVMTNTITNYRTAFNWGLMTYQMRSKPPTLYNTYAYFLGSDTGMVFTDDCVPSTASAMTPGTSASNGNRRCVPNPQPFAGGSFVTFDQSGDDPSINDVLYYGSGTPLSSLWGLAAGGTNYDIYTQHNIINSWTAGDFSGGCGVLWGCPWTFTPTDAGYLSSDPPITRQLYLPRAWGYLSDITGAGQLNEPVQPDSTTHFNNLMTLLAPETNSSTPEIKNGAVFTPLTGTLGSAQTYFSTSYGSPSQTSPITQTCQKNFVILVTDGLPTGDTSGNLYSATARTNTYDSTTGTWTFGQAAQDAINAVTALRSTTHSGNTYDIKTYVVALGDTVANASALAVMNAMADAGGTSTAYLATDQASFNAAMSAIAKDITSQVASASAVSVNSGSLNSGTTLYQARFFSGDWSGQLLAYSIDPTTGAVAPTATWDAGQILNTQPFNTGTNARQIITYKPSSGVGVPFRWPAVPASPAANEIDLSQETALNTNASGTVDGQGAARLNYLRGDASNEGTGATNFRARPTSKLGDIVDSAPQYVAAPGFGYSDSFEPAPYSAFYNKYQNRESMIYVGANDGMLHAFDAKTGLEKFGYVPSSVYGNLSQLTSQAYSHRYYVNGSPTVGDAYFAKPTETSASWKTVLVSGLSQGGTGYFALDVTDPSTFGEANAGNIVLWEFTNTDDPDMGYSFSQPSIVKMANGRWAAIFGNGYNNTGSGHAVLYIVFLDRGNGPWVKGSNYIKIDTQVGNTTTPNGLSTPAVSDVNGDGIADAIYAGDLQGNLWKFDVSSANPASWKVAYGTSSTPQPLATATYTKGGTTVPQPITSRPITGLHPSGYDVQMVYFGTGKYLEPGDTSDMSVQTFYSVWDVDRSSPPSDPNLPSVTAPITRANLLQQSIQAEPVVNGTTYRVVSNNPIVWKYGKPAPSPSYLGWYLNLLPSSGVAQGERVVTYPLLREGRIIFTTLIPSSGACSGGGSSFLMELDASNGGRLTVSPFDVNGDGTIDNKDLVVVTINGTSVTVPVSGVGSSSILSTPTVVASGGLSNPPPPPPPCPPPKVCSPPPPACVEYKYSNTSNGSILPTMESCRGNRTRQSWIQLK